MWFKPYVDIRYTIIQLALEFYLIYGKVQKMFFNGMSLFLSTE